MTEDDDRQRIVRGMQAVYQRQAAYWDATRSRNLAERGWLDRLLAMTDPGDCVLDLGCGSGAPIATHVVAQGRRVLGIDFAPAMIALAEARMPDQRWQVGDMRALSLSETFAAIIGWDSFFHLTPDEQVAVIPRLARHLVPGGGLLLTVGPRAGEPIGAVGGEPVYHASLAPEDYRAQLSRCGLEVVDFVAEDPSCGRSVLLARRSQG